MDQVKKFLNVEGIIGQGAFGRVLLTSPLQNQVQPQVQQQVDENLKSTTIDTSSTPNTSPSRYALKCVHPILKPQRLANELRHLRDLGGQANVVQIHSAHFNEGSLFIVMEMIEHDRFADIVAHLDVSEIVMYMKNLLVALEHVHSHNIMHRDIKPANFLFNRKSKKFLLVDFGLAQQVRPRSALFGNRPQTKNPSNSISNQTSLPTTPTIKKLRVSNIHDSYSPTFRLTVGAYESPVTQNDSRFSTPTAPSRRSRCDCRGRPRTCNICSSRHDSNAPKSGTPGFKAPEVLLRYPNQTTAVDIWSAGCIFACLLSGHVPFFRDVEDNISLAEIITVFGSQRVIASAKALGIRLSIEPKREPVDLKQLCCIIRNSPDKLQVSLSDSFYDLLNRMLDPNPLTRITANEALKYPCFNLMTEV